MADLPERLRAKAAWLGSRSFAKLDGSVLREAATEIERLQTDLDRVREERDHARRVLAKVKSAVDAGDCDPMSLAIHLAMCPRLQGHKEYYVVLDHEAAEAEGARQT